MMIWLRLLLSISCLATIAGAFQQPSLVRPSFGGESHVSLVTYSTRTNRNYERVSTSPPYRNQRIRLFEKEGDGKEEIDRFDIAEVTQEVEEALKAAEAALQNQGEANTRKDAVPEPPKAAVKPPQPTKPASPPPKPLDPQTQKEVIASGLGGALVGGAAGVVLLANIEIDSEVAAVVPVATAVVVGAALATIASEEGPVGSFARTAFGKTTLGIANTVTASVKSAAVGAAKTLVAIPTNLAKSVAESVKRTVDNVVQWPGKVATKAQNEIKAIPTKVSNAAAKAADSVKAEIEAIPVKITDAATEATNKAAKEIKAIPGRVSSSVEAAAEAAVAEIAATPKRVSDAAKKQLEETVDAIESAVEETVESLTAMPKRTVTEVATRLKVKPLDPPKPPELPPPPSVTQASSSQPTTSGPPKLELKIPKVEIPKMDIPKVEIPKLNIPKPSPTPAAPAPAPAEKRESPFIFSEVSLKQFTQKVAPISSPKPAPQVTKVAPNKPAAPKTIVPLGPSPEQLAQKARQEEVARRQKEQAAKAAQLTKERNKQVEQQRAEKEAKAAQAEAERQERQKQLEQQRAEKARRETEAAAEREANAAKAAAEREQRQKQLEEQQAETARKAAEAKAAREAALEQRRKEAEAKEAARLAAKAEMERKLEKQKAMAAASKPRPSLSVLKQTPANVNKKAPRGVPTIVKWRQRRDGGITGLIYGSPNFEEGDRVETTPIVTGTIAVGNIVKTGSGSRYFLSDQVPDRTSSEAIKTLLGAVSGATIRLTQQKKEEDAREAQKALEQSKPRSTFSLFGIGGDNEGEAPAPASVSRSVSLKQQPAKRAPRGVPTLSKWKENGDGSVTGLISGSTNFSEGERVTTSPIVSGKLLSGETVKTGSGSRYFLA